MYIDLRNNIRSWAWDFLGLSCLTLLSAEPEGIKEGGYLWAGAGFLGSLTGEYCAGP